MLNTSLLGVIVILVSGETWSIQLRWFSLHPPSWARSIAMSSKAKTQERRTKGTALQPTERSKTVTEHLYQPEVVTRALHSSKSEASQYPWN